MIMDRFYLVWLPERERYAGVLLENMIEAKTVANSLGGEVREFHSPVPGGSIEIDRAWYENSEKYALEDGGESGDGTD